MKILLKWHLQELQYMLQSSGLCIRMAITWRHVVCDSVGGHHPRLDPRVDLTNKLSFVNRCQANNRSALAVIGCAKYETPPDELHLTLGASSNVNDVTGRVEQTRWHSRDVASWHGWAGTTCTHGCTIDCAHFVAHSRHAFTTRLQQWLPVFFNLAPVNLLYLK